MGTSEAYQTGLNWKTIAGLLVSISIFVPTNIYATFMLGASLGGASTFVIALLFTEIARLFYVKFNRQEVTVLYYAASWGGAALPAYYGLVYTAYFINSPLAWSYRISGQPLATLVPSWLTPPYGSPSLEVRTLFQPAWVIPILLFTLTIVLSFFVQMSMATITARIYVEQLKYPFPLAAPILSMATFVSERPKGIMKILITALSIGIFYGGIAYLPYSLGFKVVPLPFADLTWLSENIMPGSLLAIQTQLMLYVSGLLIPLDVTTYASATSIMIWIILNSLFVTTFTGWFPKWASEYVKGMGVLAIQNRAFVRAWFSPQVGFTIAISLFLIYKVRKTIISMFKGISKTSEKSELGFPSIRNMLILFLASSIASIAVINFLIPGIPLWVFLVYSLLLSFSTAIFTTASVAETGFAPTINTLSIWQTLVYLTPYQGYIGFGYPPAIAGDVSGFSQIIKVAEETKTKPTDFIKVWTLGLFFTQLVGLLVMDMFWRIAPIPSSAYPMSLQLFLSYAFMEAMASTRQIVVTPNLIFIPMIIVLSILLVGDILSTKGLFFSALGIAIGLFTLPSVALALLVGSLVGRFVAPRFIGKERWNEVKGYVVLGELTGEGIILMISTALSLIAKSSWLWPW